jgi:hypothetical protein
MVRDLYYKPLHYNLKYKTGALLNRITAHDFEQIRFATPEEIQALCKRAPKPVTPQRFSDCCGK